ncbi:MAG: ribosomal protein L32 [Candidatus Xenolissoclinum pacificiensis L6]|uniref:Large ribosomal subunit protein bL32 n=1 Tax=Candidatus Xenolissoclinum pacificiensis L6 TaxID=1401685 RepID=W2V067_9RICK|nr:MAG: ribosomal protein L32 [Candidatus Xenolissoclinum pacificiensis L6]
MAVPKRKTTPMKRGQRNSHSKSGLKQAVYESTTGDITLPGRLSVNLYYKGKSYARNNN